MANRILSVLFKKKYTSGDTDTIYMRNRAKDVYTGEAGSATMDTIVTKVNGMAAGATKVAGSSSNGYISINGTNTKVYTHPNSGATAGTYNQVTVNAQGHVTAGSNITTWTGSVSGSVANATSTFTRASSRANLTSGEKISISLGKISKWFADLKSLAFVDKVGVSNLDSTLTTQYNKRVTTDDVTQSTSITEAGWVADARVIRTLQNQINTLNSKASNLENSLNNKVNKYSSELVWADLGTSGTDEVRLRKTGENLGNFGLCFVYNKNGAGTLRYDNIYDTYGNFLLTKYEKYAQIVYQTCSFKAGTSLTNEAFKDHMFFIFNITILLNKQQ